MTATKLDIESWYNTAQKKKAKYLIIGHDWWDHDNFPIYVMEGESCKDRIDELIKSGNRYDEVYDLSLDRKTQLAERRAIHIPLDSKEDKQKEQRKKNEQRKKALR